MKTEINGIGLRHYAEFVRAAQHRVIVKLGIPEDDDGSFIFVLNWDRYYANPVVLKFSVGDNSCCEHRYFHTDDDLSSYVGSSIDDIEVREMPDEEDESGNVLESDAIIVTTNKGQFTIMNYNAHNGYYGGVSLEIETDS